MFPKLWPLILSLWSEVNKPTEIRNSLMVVGCVHNVYRIPSAGYIHKWPIMKTFSWISGTDASWALYAGDTAFCEKVIRKWFVGICINMMGCPLAGLNGKLQAWDIWKFSPVIVCRGVTVKLVLMVLPQQLCIFYFSHKSLQSQNVL